MTSLTATASVQVPTTFPKLVLLTTPTYENDRITIDSPRRSIPGAVLWSALGACVATVAVAAVMTFHLGAILPSSNAASHQHAPSAASIAPSSQGQLPPLGIATPTAAQLASESQVQLPPVANLTSAQTSQAPAIQGQLPAMGIVTP